LRAISASISCVVQETRRLDMPVARAGRVLFGYRECAVILCAIV